MSTQSATSDGTQAVKQTTVERWSWLAESLSDTDVSPDALAELDASCAGTTLGKAMAYMDMHPSEPTSSCSSCVAYDSGAASMSITPPSDWRPASTIYVPPAPASSSALESPAFTRCASLDLDAIEPRVR
jgi:hypothetical protein